MIRELVNLIRDTSFPDEDRHWTVPCWAGALMAAILWFAADQWVQLSRHGQLFGFPKLSLTGFLVCATIGCVIGAVGGWGERTWRSRHVEGTRAVARQMGFSWFPSAEIHRAPTRVFPMLADWHKGDRLMDGERDDISVQVFDLTIMTTDVDGSGLSHSTVVLLPAPDLPELDLLRRWLLTVGKWSGLQFTPGDDMSASDIAVLSEFTRMYVVYCGFEKAGCAPTGTPEAEQAIRQFLTPSVMQALIPFPNWWIETRGGRMALSLGRGFRPPAERLLMIDQALAIRRILMQRAGELKEVTAGS
ncbi:MAG TPA: hypothetical protein EYG03_14815 [Planctomycetes bacterium]|nr:hypothetical protein [Planctomycetota bacterium]